MSALAFSSKAFSFFNLLISFCKASICSCLPTPMNKLIKSLFRKSIVCLSSLPVLSLPTLNSWYFQFLAKSSVRLTVFLKEWLFISFYFFRQLAHSPLQKFHILMALSPYFNSFVSLIPYHHPFEYSPDGFCSD